MVPIAKTKTAITNSNSDSPFCPPRLAINPARQFLGCIDPARTCAFAMGKTQFKRANAAVWQDHNIGLI